MANGCRLRRYVWAVLLTVTLERARAWRQQWREHWSEVEHFVAITAQAASPPTVEWLSTLEAILARQARLNWSRPQWVFHRPRVNQEVLQGISSVLTSTYE